MVKIKDLRKDALLELEKINLDSPRADVDVILKSLGFSKTEIILGDKEVSAECEKQFQNALARLKAGEPVQYIVGVCEFMSMDFFVNEGVLIPRCDTEILVETVRDICCRMENPFIFEVGSGSGCIAVSLGKLLPKSEVLSVDISDDALEVARVNAQKNGVSENVRFMKRDILEGFPDFERLPDVIVSNPPYIPRKDIEDLEKKVKDFEPLTALDGGEDGLDFYRFITINAPLEKNGYLAFEVGVHQAQSVKEIMSQRFCDIKIIPDLSGIERVVVGRLK